ESRGGGGPVTDFDSGPQTAGGLRYDPLGVLDHHRVGEQVLFGADFDDVAFGIDSGHKSTLAERHAQTTTLADGKSGDPIVASDDGAVAVADGAGALIWQPTGNEGLIVTVRHEANVGAVGLIEQRQAHLTSELAN